MYQSRPTVAINHMRTLKILQTSWAVTWPLTSTWSVIPLSATHINLSILHFLSGSWYEAPPNLQGQLLGLLLRSAPPAPRSELPALWGFELFMCFQWGADCAHWHCWCIHWVCPYFKKLVNVLMLDFKTVGCLLHKCFLKACVQGKLVPRSTHFKTLYAAVN